MPSLRSRLVPGYLRITRANRIYTSPDEARKHIEQLRFDHAVLARRADCARTCRCPSTTDWAGRSIRSRPREARLAGVSSTCTAAGG